MCEGRCTTECAERDGRKGRWGCVGGGEGDPREQSVLPKFKMTVTYILHVAFCQLPFNSVLLLVRT